MPYVLAVIFVSYWFSTPGSVSDSLWIWWAAMVWAIGLDIVLIVKYMNESKKENLDAHRWMSYFAFASSNMGLCFNYFYHVVDLQLDSNVIFALGIYGMNILATTLNVGLKRSIYYAYMTPSVLLPGIAFWQADFFFGFCIFSSAVIAVSVAFSQKINTLFHRSLNLQMDKDELLHKLTDQKNIAESASLAKTKFLAAASHDLRQPLQSLSLLLSALFAHIDTLKQKEILDKAQSSLNALSELLDSLLDISKIDAQLIKPSISVFNLKALLQQEISKNQPMVEYKGLKILLQFSGKEVISSDPVLISRIMSNLISNACKYTDSGQIQIIVESSDQGAVIHCKDTGIGIPPGDIDRVFDEFYQVDNPERNRMKGLGLGLFIVRRLCDLLDAKIHLASELGTGSTFTLVLKDAVSKLPANSDEVTAKIIGNINGLRILVIDDEVLVRDSTRLLLESWGCQVNTHANLDEALEYLASSKQVPDALIVDYRLRNHQNGVECIREIQLKLGVNLPSLIITGDTAPERVKELEDSQIPFIHKPIDANQLRGFLGAI